MVLERTDLPDLPADEVRIQRLAEIRARRGSAERLAHIDQLATAKAKTKKAPSSAGNRKTPENSSEMFGHPWPFWFRMRDAGLQFLRDSASQRKMVTYGELWDAITLEVGEDCGNAWRQRPNLLGYIAEQGYQDLGYIPTALVIYREDDDGDGTEHPGPGFFRLAVTLGAITADLAPAAGEEWTVMTDQQREFWQSQVQGMFSR
jgi:hypothetical protein